MGALMALFAIVSIAWDALEVTKPEITAYCKTEAFVERAYPSFPECQASLRLDIERHGYVCGCRRTDGIYGPVTKVTQWIL
jgi:hypothetical protein